MLAFDCSLNYCSFGSIFQERVRDWEREGLRVWFRVCKIHKRRIVGCLFYEDTAFSSIINTSVVYVRWVALWGYITVHSDHCSPHL